MTDKLSNAARIMVVDDTPENLTLLNDMLQNRGYEVFALPNGEMALKAAARNPPDLMLLDINMPGLNGYEVCRRLKADKHLAEIPVIFLSALTETEDKVKAFHVGGVDYITKPFQFEEVDARVRTHLKLREQKREIEQSYERLKQLENLRDNLVHMIVHDMRSPLAAMMGYLDLLTYSQNDELSPTAATFIAAAAASTSNLLEMVNSLLDISRMEAGQLPLNLAECNVAEIISEVLGKLGPLKAKRRIIVDMPESLRVTADRNLIVRLIQNLTDNAFGFTPEDGQVCIGAQRQKDHIRVFVADNGLGIPSEYQERIFEKFGQVEARKNGRKYSTGLGLTFCKLAVEAHGGRIGVDSEVGKGSTFWFELPRVAGQPGSRE